MKKWKITCISDTHSQHKVLDDGFLLGGDILIHAGDISGRGSLPELNYFFEWYDNINGYNHKVFIAGNHDFGFQDYLPEVNNFLNNHITINYLQDNYLIVGDEHNRLKIWGTPWQPEFYNWAFNLPRGEKIKEKWDLIPKDIDILIVHGPPNSKLDLVNHGFINVGCEELMKKIGEIKPKIVVYGHIHEGYGYIFDGNTHYINASILDDKYVFKNKPITFEWDNINNELNFL